MAEQPEERLLAAGNAQEGLLAIRDKFIANVDRSIDMAHSLTALVGWGQIQLKAHVERYPDATFSVGVGHPDTATLRTVGRPVQRLLDIFSDRNTVTDELIHAQVIQYWHDFLDEVLLELVRRHFTGSSPYVGLGVVHLKVDCRQITHQNLVDQLIEGAAREVAFMDATDKLRLAARALGVSIPAQSMRAIKKHVTVRNVLQHNDGILRHEDLRRLGLVGAGLPMTDKKGKPLVRRAGERVSVSFWELMMLCSDLLEAATLLVPDTEAQR